MQVSKDQKKLTIFEKQFIRKLLHRETAYCKRHITNRSTGRLPPSASLQGASGGIRWLPQSLFALISFAYWQMSQSQALLENYLND